MNKKQPVRITSVITIGAVWFGAHVGGGFATGNQGFQYFAKYGWIGLIMPVLIMALVGWSNREVVRSARFSGTTNYRSWSLQAYKPVEKPMSVVLEVETLTLYLLASSGAIAGCASLFENFGLPYLVGVLITGLILMALSIFGAGIFEKASSIMSMFLACSILVILAVGISRGAASIGTSIATVDTRSFSAWDVIWSGLKYGGFQAFCGITMIPIAVGIASERELNSGFGFGFLLNSVMTVLVSLFLLVWYPVVSGQTLPILTVLNGFDNQFLVLLYSVSLALAFLTTALGAVFGTVSRFEPVLKHVNMSNIVKRIIISVGFMAVAMGISLVGLDRIVKIGYGYVGVIAVFTIILPAITVMFTRNNKTAKLGASKQTNVNPSTPPQ